MASAITMVQRSGFTFINMAVTLVTVLLLLTKKVPAPFIVLMAILLGIFL
ncbi:hypothetical protein P7G58_06510 [Globicatella sulfidifaciens]|nr:hypothetical protein [Globicatella sulfidifaciens]MDT2768508.1 hypothetical protein [Globicatella sulfidifaciens]